MAGRLAPVRATDHQDHPLATPAVIVVVTVALLTLVALGLMVLAMMRHLRGLSATLARMQNDLGPTLDRLAADAEVTRTELERVSDRAARLDEGR